MIASLVSRWPFLAAVALVSAAVSDVLVETVANTGVFGAEYYDTNDACIVPSLIAALLLAGYVIGLHVLALVRRSPARRRDWLVDAARELATQNPWRGFPAIILMQFGALFAIESIEYIAATGHVAAGALLWLGGPVLAAGMMHVTVAAACTFAAGRLMRLSVASVASLVRIALEFVLCARGARGTAAFAIPRDAASCSHAQAAGVRHISGRAPPFPPRPA